MPRGPKNSSRFGEASQCSTSSTSCVISSVVMCRACHRTHHTSNSQSGLPCGQLRHQPQQAVQSTRAAAYDTFRKPAHLPRSARPQPPMSGLLCTATLVGPYRRATSTPAGMRARGFPYVLALLVHRGRGTGRSLRVARPAGQASVATRKGAPTSGPNTSVGGQASAVRTGDLLEQTGHQRRRLPRSGQRPHLAAIRAADRQTKLPMTGRPDYSSRTESSTPTTRSRLSSATYTSTSPAPT